MAAFHTKGAFFWDYSVYSYFGIGITEYNEYQFPIKQIARYSENRIADVIKTDRRGRAIFPPKYYNSILAGKLRVREIPSILLSGAE